LKNAGIGRIGYLSQPLKLTEILDIVKSHFNMKTVRLAIGNGKNLDTKIKVIAVGAGSGSKVVNNTSADLIITGEFSHHEILHEVHRGVSVIVTDHTNNERGHHKYFRDKFLELLKKYNENVEIEISEVDRDPLEYF
jgi:putative NIF3 family GTP cyclohydrolase 1 type 2